MPAAEELRMAADLKTRSGNARTGKSRAEELRSLAAEEGGSRNGICIRDYARRGNRWHATPASEVGAAPAWEYEHTVSGEEVPLPRRMNYVCGNTGRRSVAATAGNNACEGEKRPRRPLKRKEGYPTFTWNFLSARNKPLYRLGGETNGMKKLSLRLNSGKIPVSGGSRPRYAKPDSGGRNLR